MLDLVRVLEVGLDEVESKEWDPLKIHVSDLSVSIENEREKKCPRELWLRLQGAKKRKLKPGEKLMFKQGNNLHELAVELIRKGLLGKTPDVRFIFDNAEQPAEIQGIIGKYDCKLADYSGDSIKEMIVDFKSLRGNAFNYLDKAKPSNVLQVQAYMMAVNADYGMLLYIDREGQNFARQFKVERNDPAAQKAINKTKDIANSKNPPDVMEPTIVHKKNKKSTAVYIKEPWQCSRCLYCNVSCQSWISGDVRKNYDEKKTKKGEMLIGHLVEDETFDETFKAKTTDKEILKMAGLLEVS